MSAVLDGQMDIFDKLPSTVPMVTCPHCGHSWTKGDRFTEEHWMDVHTRRNGGTWDDWPGACLNQRVTLCRLYSRIVNPDASHEFDLIALLAMTACQRIDTAHVLGVLAMAEKRTGGTA